MGQYDFDTRYFTINATSLPEAPSLDKTLELTMVDETPDTFILDNTPTFEATLKSLRINSSNYWEAVDMRTALGSSTRYIDTNINITPIKTEYNGFSVSMYASDGSSRVKNTVYKEVRGLNLLDPCPAFGICPRCAPYRYNQR